MGSEEPTSGATNAGGNVVKIDAGTISTGGSLTINAGMPEAQVRQLVADTLAKGNAFPLPTVANNFADARIVWNRLFTGREDELARLHAALAQKSQALSHAVTGAGGVGKTELARAYAFLFAQEFDGVWWVDASDGGFSDSISRTFKVATGQTTPHDARPEDLAAQLCQRWSHGKHLIILDNVESPSRLSTFALSGGCRLLATTRKDLSAAAITESFKVDVISENAAVDLLTKQTMARKPAIPATELRLIAVEVGCHTLAVALAGAYLGRYGDVSAAEYLERIRIQGTGEADSREDGEEHDPLLLRYRHGVRSCLSLHFDKFAGKRQMVLLGLASFCAPTAIPLDILASAAHVDLATARVMVRSLADLSIIEYQNTISMHRLTQGVVRSMLDAQSRELMIDAMVEVLGVEFEDPDDHTRWPRSSTLASHADAVIMHSASDHPTQNAGKLANALGRYLRKAGRFADVQRTYAVCHALTSRTFGADHPNMAVLLSNIAANQRDLGDPVGAQASIEGAIAIQSKHLDSDDLDFAITYGNLAAIQRVQGSLDDAYANVQKAIAIRSKHLPADDLSFANQFSNLALIHEDRASLHRKNGEFAKANDELAAALVSMEKAIAIELEHLDPDHPNLAVRYINLSGIQRTHGDLQGARVSIEKAIAIKLKHLAPDHPHFGTSYNNLAHICLDEGDTAGACANLKRALDILLKHFGENHPQVQSVRQGMRTIGC